MTVFVVMFRKVITRIIHFYSISLYLIRDVIYKYLLSKLFTFRTKKDKHDMKIRLYLVNQHAISSDYRTLKTKFDIFRISE